MKPKLKQAIDAELTAAIAQYRKGKLDNACRHLEVVHVLGQRYVVPHTVSHWWMLKIALKRRSFSDALGQSVRIVLGAVGSAIGIVPVGNTGGTNISMFKRLPINEQIRHLID